MNGKDVAILAAVVVMVVEWRVQLPRMLTMTTHWIWGHRLLDADTIRTLVSLELYLATLPLSFATKELLGEAAECRKKAIAGLRKFDQRPLPPGPLLQTDMLDLRPLHPKMDFQMMKVVGSAPCTLNRLHLQTLVGLHRRLSSLSLFLKHC